MRGAQLLAAALLSSLFVCAQNSPQPGAFERMAIGTVGQVPTLHAALSTIPEEGLRTTVLTCLYTSNRTGYNRFDVRRFWYGVAPAWLNTLPAGHPIFSTISGAARACPQTVAAADSVAAAAAPPRHVEVAETPAPVAPVSPVEPVPRTDTAPSLAEPVTAPASTPTAPPAKAIQGDLMTAGLTNAAAIAALYRGDFASIRIEREDPAFAILFSEYLEAYGQRCDAQLPSNKVEIMHDRCSREEYPVNGFGMQVGASHCIEYARDDPSGIYADPVLYSAKERLDNLISGNTLRDAFRMMRQMTQSNSLSAPMALVSDGLTMKSDAYALVRGNSCSSPALARFAENLRLFALGKQPIPLDGTAPAEPLAAVFSDSDYRRLVDDLIAEQSKSWSLNQYISGSASEVHVVSRDSQGRPASVAGAYLYSGFNGRSRGTVTVDFNDGVPECLYFFDFPTTCRSANRRIAAAYLQGGYRH